METLQGASHLVDHPEEAVPARGAFMAQLVVVELQENSQLLPAADDGGQVLQRRRCPRKAGHWRGK